MKFIHLAEHCMLPAARPDWPELLSDWQPLLPPGAVPWLLTKFGEVFFEQSNKKIGMLQVSGFQYEVVADDANDFDEWLEDPDKLAEWFLAPLVERIETEGKLIEGDGCYSFIRPLALGGTAVPENVMMIPIREHFRCWGNVYQQVKDAQDGTQVQLKVV